MELVKKAELKLADMFKGAPKLQDSTKETIVKIVPWLALIGGVVQLIWAWTAFSWARSADDITNSVNEFYSAIGAPQVANERVSFWLWIAVIMLLVEAVLLLVAYPKLRARQKSGWDLLFILGLINVVYAVVSLFSDYRGGFLALVWNLFVTVVIFWLLFAIRDKYNGGHKVRTPHTVVGHTETKTEKPEEK